MGYKKPSVVSNFILKPFRDFFRSSSSILENVDLPDATEPATPIINGYFFFGNIPDYLSLAGITLIILGGWALFFREHQRNKIHL